MKKVNKILSVLLSLIMIFSIIPMTSITASAATSGTCGENTYWNFNESTGTLTISGTGAMYDFDDGPTPWKTYKGSIDKVIIHYGVTSIGYDAFSRCSNLSSVSIPDSVTSIGNQSFYGCSSLDNLVIPDSVKTIYPLAFDGCTFERVRIGKGVEQIGLQAFFNCYNLRFVHYSGTKEQWDKIKIYGSNEKLVNAVVYENSKLNNVTYGKCGDNVIWKFEEEDGFLYITGDGPMYNYTISNYTELPWQKHDFVVKRVHVQDGVSSIGDYAFFDIADLKTIITEESVLTIGEYAFWNSENLSSVTLKEGLVTICEGAIKNCDKLEKIVIPNSVKTIGDEAFASCDSLTIVELGSGIITIGEYAFHMCPATNITLPESVVTISEGAFAQCENLVNIKIGQNVSQICGYAFFDCTNLKDVYYSGSKTQWNLLDIGNENNYLTNATIHYGDSDYIVNGICGANVEWTLNVTTGEMVISGTGSMYDFELANVSGDVVCPWEVYKQDIKTVTIDNGVTSVGNGAFEDCSNLAEVNFSKSVNSIGNGAFSGCTGLEEIDIPDSITEIDIWAFSECISLKNIKLSNSLTEINQYIFYNCTSLTECIIPESVTKVAHSAFAQCNNLAEVTIPNNVTYVGTFAFRECNKLKSVTLNKNIDEIGYGAFSDCNSLIDVYYLGTENQWKRILIDELNNCLTEANIHFNDVIKGSCGANVTWKYDDTTGTLTISGTGAMSDDDYDERPWNDFEDDIKKVVIENGVTTVSYYGFYDCDNLTSIIIPASVTQLGNVAVGFCDNLSSITVDSNNSYYSSDEYGVLFNRNKTELIQYPIGNTRTNYTIPDSVVSIASYAFCGGDSLKDVTIGNKVTTIGEHAFAWCINITNVTIPVSVTKIMGYAFYDCDRLTNIYYSGKQSQWNQIMIGEENIPLLNANIYFKEDIYNLGEETYSFDNFGDSDSAGGHCFGMSITSAGYYNNILDITSIGGSAEKDLYELSKTAKVKNPICHYQAIQGNFSKRAIVAGGKWYLTKVSNINADWNAVVNYVKNHQYDNKGTLQIGFRNSRGGHAINFLRYEVVNGQERIYAYDNNFPETETYFYKSADGNVYQAPKSTFGTAIDTICLRDIYTYFSGIGEYDKTRYIYGDANEIDVVGAEAFPMECGEGNYTMYELPEEATEAVIIPLVDNATFQYVGEEFSFGNVDENTIGNLVLSTNENDSITEPEFNVEEVPCADGHDFLYGFCTRCGESDIIESAHPYDDDTDETYVIYKEDASYIYIRFSRDTYVEENYDFIEIYDMDDNLVGRYTGDELASEQITVYGDTAKIRLISDSSNTEYGFKINDMSYMIIPGTDGDSTYGFHIQTPSKTTIRNKDTIVLHAVTDGELPEGYTIEWDCKGYFSLGWDIGNRFDTYVTAEDKGYDTITATLYDADGNVLATDSVELYSKSGFFDKIGGFFRSLFGTTKTYDEY